MKKAIDSIKDEPYRLFFPLGALFVLWGALIWLPLIWSGESYPVIAHRYLMLSGFTACFIGGFLMTAVPRFSQTDKARGFELIGFLLITLAGLGFSLQDAEEYAFAFSALQALLLLFFLSSRISRRKQNPPYSFIFISVGLILWLVSAGMASFNYLEIFRVIQQEGAITAIILGVGARLIPGIMGHTEIVSQQRATYERPVALIKTVPLPFALMIVIFVVSYFLDSRIGDIARALIVALVAFKFWRLYRLPAEKSALTNCLWVSCWLIVLSFWFKLLWPEGGIHVSHSFFINGIVLLSLLVATRVLQSHGPSDKTLENRKVLYAVTFLIVFAAATRISAYLMPDSYLRHLAYSSIVLSLGVLLWSWKYLRYIGSGHRL